MKIFDTYRGDKKTNEKIKTIKTISNLSEVKDIEKMIYLNKLRAKREARKRK